MFDNKRAVGHISSIDRTFGQGKNNVINKYTVMVADARSTEKSVDLFDRVGMNDSDFVTKGYITRINMTDSIALNDKDLFGAVSLELSDSLELNDDTIRAELTRNLSIVDSLVIDDSVMVFNNHRHLFLADTVLMDGEELRMGFKLFQGLTDAVAIDDSGISYYKSRRLNMSDQIIVDDVNLVINRHSTLDLSDTIIVDEDNKNVRHRVRRPTDGIVLEDENIIPSRNVGVVLASTVELTDIDFLTEYYRRHLYIDTDLIVDGELITFARHIKFNLDESLSIADIRLGYTVRLSVTDSIVQDDSVMSYTAIVKLKLSDSITISEVYDGTKGTELLFIEKIGIDDSLMAIFGTVKRFQLRETAYISDKSCKLSRHITLDLVDSVVATDDDLIILL
ncbi:MAG: hypothetical protein DRN30_06185 [Thermoplasmata archaeon]|nr:MAG: hypothetical protein DRN30_06185 [Thermoplasmata archaeon]